MMRYFESHKENELIYIITEYIDGIDFESYIESRIDLNIMDPISTLNYYIFQLASMLDFLHSKGIVHRDIKANNIIMKGDLLILIDFGFACFYIGDKLRSNIVAGTPSIFLLKCLV